MNKKDKLIGIWTLMKTLILTSSDQPQIYSLMGKGLKSGEKRIKILMIFLIYFVDLFCWFGK